MTTDLPPAPPRPGRGLLHDAGRSTRSRLGLAVLSGVLLGTSYIPFPPWAIFFCYVPLWFVWLRGGSWRSVVWTGWVAQLVGTLIGFNWVAYTVHEFGGLPWPLAGVVLLLFAAVANLQMPLAGLAWWALGRRLPLHGALRIWALPVLAGILERVFPMIFDWNFGYTWLWAGFPAFHLADVIGFMGLSTVGLVFNAMILHGVERARAGARGWPWVASVPALFLAMNVGGHLHGRPAPTDATLRVLVVQPNVGNQEKLAAEQGDRHRDVVFERLAGLTREGLGGNRPVDLVVWPETAFPEPIEDAALSDGLPARLRELVAASGTRFVVGGYSFLPDTGQPTNSFFLLDRTGEWLAPPYHKTLLLAFGEYLPGEALVPGLRDLLPQVGDFGRGPGPTVLDAGGVRIGAQICYEGLFDWFSSRQAGLGAHVIVNLTNDAWYGTWQQPYQHLTMTLARAVEIRRPLVRSTNTGISAAILASGEVLARSPTAAPWQHVYEIPYATRPAATAFMTTGGRLVPIALGLALGFIVLAALARRAGTAGEGAGTAAAR